MKNPRSSPARRARLADSPPGDGGLRYLCLAVALALVVAGSVFAQPVIIPIITSTVATLPAGASTGAVRLITDGASADDCATGGGSTYVWCVKTGAGWVAFGDGGGAGGSGDVTAVGDCATGNCFQSTTATHAFMAPVGGGVASFRAITDADIPDTITVDLATAATTATALAANGTNCSAGSYPLGVDASGNAEDCTAAGGGSGDVVGPASSTDNAVAIWDGTTGELLQDSTLLWDGADLTLPTATQIQVPYGTTTDPAVEFPGGSGIFGEASNGRVIVTNNGGAAYFQFQIGSGATRTFGGNVTGSPQMMNMAPSTTSPNIVLRNNDTTTGLGSNAVGDLRLVAAGVSSLGVTSTETTLYVEQVNSPAAQTCADDGTGAAATLILTVSGLTYKAITNSDPDGCTVIVSETGASNGQRLELIVVSNAGGSVSYLDTAGVTEIADGGFAAAVYDSITYRYASDRWVEVSRSDN